jgi:hypothetical protein
LFGYINYRILFLLEKQGVTTPEVVGWKLDTLEEMYSEDNMP